MEKDIKTMRVEFLDLMRKLHKAGPPWMPTCEGLTPNQVRALHLIYVLEQSGGADAARPGILAGHMAVSPSALSQVVKALEKRGLVTRGRGEGDFRAVALQLTPAGTELGRSLDDQFVERLRALVDYVGPELFAQMMEGVARAVEFRLTQVGPSGAEAGCGCECAVSDALVAGRPDGEEAPCTC